MVFPTTIFAIYIYIYIYIMELLKLPSYLSTDVINSQSAFILFLHILFLNVSNYQLFFFFFLNVGNYQPALSKLFPNIDF
jgi:hypothetical protein